MYLASNHREKLNAFSVRADELARGLGRGKQLFGCPFVLPALQVEEESHYSLFLCVNYSPAYLLLETFLPQDPVCQPVKSQSQVVAPKTPTPNQARTILRSSSGNLQKEEREPTAQHRPAKSNRAQAWHDFNSLLALQSPNCWAPFERLLASFFTFTPLGCPRRQRHASCPLLQTGGRAEPRFAVASRGCFCCCGGPSSSSCRSSRGPRDSSFVIRWGQGWKGGGESQPACLPACLRLGEGLPLAWLLSCPTHANEKSALRLPRAKPPNPVPKYLLPLS